MDDLKTDNKQLKVCFISLYAYPLFDKSKVCVQGGAELDTYMIATELALDTNFDVHFITGDFDQPDITNYENVTIHKTVNLKSPIRAILSLWRALKKANCDIYFKKGASLITFLVALFCHIHHRIFIIRTAQEIECNGIYIRQKWLRGRAFLWTLKQAVQVLVQSNDNKKLLRETAGISATVIPNGHRIETQSELKREYILWVGRSAEVKGPDYFFKLAMETPSEKFVMICQQAGDDLTILNSELANKALSISNLKFIERVPFHEIDNFFQQAKVLVNTSRTEGFPNTFIQACKCSTPILSLNVNPDDFLTEYKCGLCANGNWQTFKEMLAILLESKTMYQYGHNGLKYVIKNHDISKIIEEYKSIFIQAAQDR
jgi:glycosyltransferase involved in cell wall biosynthesis